MTKPLYSEATKRLLVTTLPDDTITHKELIEERILQLQEEIRALRHTQNALLPVCRLPVELLAEIFVCLRDDGVIEGSWTAKPWIACTQVCQHWRNVAVNCPSLWSNLDLGSKELAELMIARSRGTALNIKLDRPHSKEVDVLREVLTSESIVSRLQSIEVTALLTPLGPRVFESWANQRFKAPLLERMNIISRTDSADFGDLGPFSTKDTPVLRHLSLQTQSIDWSGIDVGRNLACLDLSQVSSSPRPSTVLMCSILQQARNLQELSLVNCLPSPSTSNPPSLSMECLQSLRLDDEESNVLHFLKLTHFPEARKITIIFQCDSDWASPLELNDARSILLAALECRPDGSSTPQSFRKPYSIAITDTVDALVAEFSFLEGIATHLTLGLVSWDDATVNQLVLSIVNEMDCSETNELSLHFVGSGSVPVESWRAISSCPHLQSLTLYTDDGDILFTFLDFLKLNPPSSPDPGAFPALSTLFIGFLELYSRGSAEAIIEELVKAFSGGHGRRPPLKKLTVQGSIGFSSSDEERLRRELDKTEIAWIDNEELTEEEIL